jgi:hypothetical protein
VALFTADLLGQVPPFEVISFLISHCLHSYEDMPTGCHLDASLPLSSRQQVFNFCSHFQLLFHHPCFVVTVSVSYLDAQKLSSPFSFFSHKFFASLSTFSFCSSDVTFEFTGLCTAVSSFFPSQIADGIVIGSHNLVSATILSSSLSSPLAGFTAVDSFRP